LVYHRFHSLYVWHKEGEYNWLESPQDVKYKPWVQTFNKYDLYTKENKKVDEEEMREKFSSLVHKFIPSGYLHW